MPKVKEMLKRIKKLEIKTGRLVHGLIAGNYRSVFKGRGIEFSEVREYIPGDDIRTIDWNVTARYNLPYVKEFIEERDLNVYIIFDISASGNFGYEKSKKEVGFEIAASIMNAALRNNDNIGLCLFTDRIEKFLRPRKGKKHFFRALRELVYSMPKYTGTNINNSLRHLSRIIRKGSILFIISDFISEGFEKPLRFLRNKHDVILINLNDVNELQIPDIGYTYLEDEETGEQILVNTSDKEFRELYSKHIRQKNEALKARMRRLHIDTIEVHSNEPFHVPLRRFFRQRERRIC